MRIVKIETENVAGVPDGAYRFLRHPNAASDRLTLLVGPRGGGKTQLLSAVVFAKECIGGYGPPQRPESLLRMGATSGSLRATFLLDADEQRGCEQDAPEVELAVELGGDAPLPSVAKPVRDLFARFNFDSSSSKLELFPDSRNLDLPGTPTTADQERRLRPTRLPHKYAGLVPSLGALSTLDGARALEESARRGLLFAEDRPDSLSPYRRAVARLVPELQLMGVHEGVSGPELRFALRSGAMVPVTALSAGQKQGLLFAATIQRLGLGRSLILIDTPELYLHASDHESFLRGLLELAPNAQFVVATGSSSLVQMVTREQTLTLLGHSPAQPSVGK